MTNETNGKLIDSDLLVDYVVVTTYSKSVQICESVIPSPLRCSLSEFLSIRDSFKNTLISELDQMKQKSTETSEKSKKPIEMFILASQVAFANVRMRKVIKDIAVEETIVPDSSSSHRINVDGLWKLEPRESEPWDALLDILGIEHKKTTLTSNIKPSSQEFSQNGDRIIHKIFSENEAGMISMTFDRMLLLFPI